MGDKKKKSIFSKENNTAFYGEIGERNLKGCLILILAFILWLISMAIVEPSFFYSLGK
jgi:hypothetical protein